MPTGPDVDTVIIYTADMQRLADFYCAGFDLEPPAGYGPDHVGLQVGHVYLGFDRVDEAPATPGPLSIWVRVDDLEATFARFEELGARVRFPPTKKPWGDTLAAVYDPDGNVVGLSQRVET